jgi:hypothetical protein
MKRLLQFFFTICTFIIYSCSFTGERVRGSGHIKTEDRKVRSADRIKVLGSMDVQIDSGEANVRVEADDNILRYVLTETDDDWLEIKTRDNININTSKPIKIYITTPSVSAITVSGSGNVTMDKTFYSNNKVGINISGSGNITCNINAPRVDANLAGSGTLHIAGETRDVDVDIAGSGNYDGDKLKAENAVVNIAGSGDASLFADNSLRVKVMGSGNVKYRGNASVNKNIMGSGSVSKMP